MQCPKCKSHSVFLSNGQHVCGVYGCTYTSFHPISYDNDVRQYDGEKNAANRYSSLYSNPMESGGVSVAKQAAFDKQFRNGVKMIQDSCHLFKICGRVQAIAEARYASILRIKIAEKDGTGNGNQNSYIEKTANSTPAQSSTTNQSLEKTENTNSQDRPSEIKEESSNGTEIKPYSSSNEKAVSNEKLAAYSLYSSCFQNQLYFEDYHIYHKWLKITHSDWRKLLKQLNNQMSQKIDYVPIEKTWHYTLRVCRKRKVDFVQQKAMKTMCENIAKAVILHNSRRTTIAACVFWQVCLHSKKYRDTISLNDICRKSKEKTEKISEKDEQKYFDCTPETIKSYFTNFIKNDLFSKFMPKFPGGEFPPEAYKMVKRD